MNAEEKFARRAVLHAELVDIDYQLEFVLAEPPSRRMADIGRELLNRRAEVCDGLIAAGYQPWCIPIDEREAKVS